MVGIFMALVWTSYCSGSAYICFTGQSRLVGVSSGENTKLIHELASVQCIICIGTMHEVNNASICSILKVVLKSLLHGHHANQTVHKIGDSMPGEEPSTGRLKVMFKVGSN